MATKQQATLFLSAVIRPTLQKIMLWSASAEELLLGTALVESDLRHRRQLGGGPARGLFQMEPATHDDIWTNFLKYQPAYAKGVEQLLSSRKANRHVELETNDQYACAMARMLYQRKSEPLPAAGDIKKMAAYWKKHYNTLKGAGDEDSYVERWASVMGGK
jgi:hypothetical protein